MHAPGALEPREELFERRLLTVSEEETRRLASRIGERLEGGETLALVGELGSGKTTFTRGLAEGLEIPDPRLVSSPTYVLEQIYPTRIPLHHYDAYRLGSEAEFLDLGFEEERREGHVLVVEWAEKVSGALPPDALTVELLPGGPEVPETVREIRLRGPRIPWTPRLAPLFPPAPAGEPGPDGLPRHPGP